MNTATTLEPTSSGLFWASLTTSVEPAARLRPTLDSEFALSQLAAFCTRVLLRAGRAPMDEPMLPRELLAIYAYGPLAFLCRKHDLNPREMATRLFHETLGASEEDAEGKAAAFARAVQERGSHLRSAMRRGAQAFAHWQADPRGFAADDFRVLVLESARPLPGKAPATSAR